ncbi:MAG: succinate dehydrogenase, hydrophobic membrane anchor protein [Gammaproteobacteria bacterium]
MVKSVLGVNHRGLTDWLIQRVSAIVMTVYFICIAVFLLMHSHTAYYEWVGLFRSTWMKISTAIVVLSLLYHAWVGIWTVLTDYVKVVWLNWVLQVIVILGLVALFFETLLILWSV